MYDLTISNSEILRPEPPSLDIGVHEALDADIYHALPYCSNSKLSKLKVSARHLKLSLDSAFDATTSSMRKGSALNTLLLETHTWSDWTIYSHPGNTKAGKAERAEASAKFSEKHLSRNYLSANEFVDVLGMQTSVQANAEANELLTLRGQSEVSIVFRWLDMLFKGRLDKLIYESDLKIGVDLKTTVDASPGFMSRRIFDFGYHRQAALYMLGCAILGRPLDAFKIVAVENTAPYNCEVYEISETFVKIGLEELEPLARRYKYCIENDYWPGYTTKTQVIEPPYWAVKNAPDYNELYLADLPRPALAA